MVEVKGLPPEDPEEPTPPTMYLQPPKWVKSGFGKSVIICPNQDHLDTL